MSDWAPGDLALCLKAGCGNHPANEGTGKLRTGSVYRVVGVRPGPFATCRAAVGLIMAEHPEHLRGFCGDRFRKIRPDEHAPCEEEFVTLINRKRVGEPA